MKWVGFFTVALVGLHTLEDLWELWGDVTMTKATYIRHWIARAICLIAVPVTIYIFSFALHFAILKKSGPGDAQMSSLFQANLEGTNIIKSPLSVFFLYVHGIYLWCCGVADAIRGCFGQTCCTARSLRSRTTATAVDCCTRTYRPTLLARSSSR